jgi:hypothetical protein
VSNYKTGTSRPSATTDCGVRAGHEAASHRRQNGLAAGLRIGANSLRLLISRPRSNVAALLRSGECGSACATPSHEDYASVESDKGDSRRLVR